MNGIVPTRLSSVADKPQRPYAVTRLNLTEDVGVSKASRQYVALVLCLETGALVIVKSFTQPLCMFLT